MAHVEKMSEERDKFSFKNRALETEMESLSKIIQENDAKFEHLLMQYKTAFEAAFPGDDDE